MEECQSITPQCEQETIESVTPTVGLVSTKSASPSVNDPSMSLLYHWMLSVMSSFLNLSPKNNSKIESSEENQNFIKNLASAFKTNDQKGNNKSIIKRITPNKKKNENAILNNTTNNINPNNSSLSTIFNSSNFITTQPVPKKTLILDLDETLVHSTLKPISHHHLTVNVLIEDIDCTFYVIKRPHVDTFLEKVAEWYDLIVFTASMQQYADPLLNQLDQNKTLKKRLFRDSCLEKDGNFVKDLERINQDLKSTIIIDNSPIAYSNNIDNAIPIDTFIGEDPNDRSLLNLLPFLEILRYVNDVRSILSLR